MSTGGSALRRLVRALTVMVAYVLAATAALTVTAAEGGYAGHEVAIYSALINHGLGRDVPLIVLADTTTGDPAAIAEHEDTRATVTELGAPADTLANWRQRNIARYPLPQPLAINASYNVVDADTLGEIFDAGDPEAGWARFFERYAGSPGLLSLSRPGYNVTLNHALVYVEHHCGAACGSARLVHLARDDIAGWQVLGTSLVWMAE